ncbi:MAG: STM4011 family radical SAM protein [Rubrivivax sp.]|nr:STM4011 family radical SAM protein [Pyrinomonadaceae bacterium]
MRLSILYRGALASCNYGCTYCPFAKHAESAAERARDAGALERFVGWVESRHGDSISVLFTPWGEALTRVRYQRALIRLTNTPHVEKAAIQTNISCRLDWVEDCDKSKLGLWTTYHPSEVARSRFLAKCFELLRRGVRFSVGVVGLKEYAEEIEALRRELPPDVYLWINAFKRIANYYEMEDLQRFEAVDPLFHINNRHHPSRGRACLCGESVISVAGDGTVRRCHFIREPIGNIYEQGFEESLRARACTNGTCGCHIGYVHMPGLNLYSVFGSGVLERVPEKFVR